MLGQDGGKALIEQELEAKVTRVLEETKAPQVWSLVTYILNYRPINSH
jgi:hypothetical protein